MTDGTTENTPHPLAEASKRIEAMANPPAPKGLDEVIKEIEAESWKEGSSRIVFLSRVKTILRANWPELKQEQR